MARTAQAAGKMGKNKGNSFERKIAKLFSIWWETRFVRTPRSGGFAQLAKEYRLCGDVATPDLSFPFSVECKKQEKWELVHLFTGKKSKLWNWWQQASTDVKKYKNGLHPILIFSKNHSPDWVMMRQSLLEKVGFQPSSRIIVKYKLTRNNLVVYLLSELLASEKEVWSVLADIKKKKKSKKKVS